MNNLYQPTQNFHSRQTFYQNEKDDTELKLIIAKKNDYVIEILHLEQLFLDQNENILIRIKLCYNQTKIFWSE